jgi:hypothetical protein
MEQAATMGLGLNISDVSGQKLFRASGIPLGTTVTELVQGLLAKMGLARNDVEGRPLTYNARLDREGRHLNGGETVGDSLENDDLIVLTPNIDAGAER